MGLAELELAQVPRLTLRVAALEAKVALFATVNAILMIGPLLVEGMLPRRAYRPPRSPHNRPAFRSASPIDSQASRSRFSQRVRRGAKPVQPPGAKLEIWNADCSMPLIGMPLISGY